MKKEETLPILLQGRRITADNITLLRDLIANNPQWCRTQLSKELCIIWDWRNQGDQLKDMSCRLLLRKLDGAGLIQLPKARHNGNNTNRHKHIQPILHSRAPISCELKELTPLDVRLVEGGYELKLFKYFLSSYHYLGWSGPVGEHSKYLVVDNKERPLACLMFGAAAWKIETRDSYIGWNANSRETKLSYICNNNRYLILPWIEVKYLASHILGLISRRISRDWEKKYKHPLYMLETFVEDNRFKGTCYKAANWKYLGKTKGRGRYDKYNESNLPIKSVLVQPLDSQFRRKLCEL
ncbi:MAG: DUF4338 domain-containing protein [bacterium]|nr:DUF4338 domain-containing protein [bacterium]